MKAIVKWIRTAAPADWRRLARKLLPHVGIVIAGMLVVFFVIDRFNKPMGFMVNEFHKVITFALALLSIYFAVRLISVDRRAERAEYRRALREAQKKKAPGAAKKTVKPAAQRTGQR